MEVVQGSKFVLFVKAGEKETTLNFIDAAAECAGDLGFCTYDSGSYYPEKNSQNGHFKGPLFAGKDPNVDNCVAALRKVKEKMGTFAARIDVLHPTTNKLVKTCNL